MADPKLTIAGDAGRAEAAIVALERKIERLQQGMKQVSRKTREAARESEQGLGQRAALSVGAYAAQFVTVTAAISAATMAMREHNRVRDEAAQRGRQATGGLAQLAQLAATPEEMTALTEEAGRLFARGAAKTLEDAAGLVFSLESAGLQGADRELFVRIAEAQLVSDPTGFADSAKAIRDAVGAAVAGDFAEITSKAVAASGFSPSRVDEIMAATAGAGGTASRMGVSDSELLAAVAVAASPAGGAAVAGTQMEAMLVALEKKKGFQGLSLDEMVEKIAAKGMQGEKLVKFFGRKEALAAFTTLKENMDQFREASAAVREAGQARIIEQRIALPEQIPQIRAARLAEQQEAETAFARTDAGTLRNMRNAVFASIQRGVEQDSGPFAAMMMNVPETIARLNPMRTDEGFLRNQEVQQALQQRDEKLFNEMIRLLESIDRKQDQQRQLKRNE